MLTTVAGSKSEPHNDKYPATPISIETSINVTQNTIELSAINNIQIKIIAKIALPNELKVVVLSSSI